MPEYTSTSISLAWQRAITFANTSPKREVLNLSITIDGLESGGPDEDTDVRTSLDDALLAGGFGSVRTVANTIFPRSLWKSSRPRGELYAKYLNLWPTIKRCPKNRRGTYFQRLISYPEPGSASFNQLDHVISTFNSGNHRRSALQASVLVPKIDLNGSRQQGFPCMQQAAFVPNGDKLRVIGFYPLQYLFERGYGNYLGLLNLGRFMAHEMNLALQSVTCVSVIAVLEQPTAATQFLLPTAGGDL